MCTCIVRQNFVVKPSYKWVTHTHEKVSRYAIVERTSKNAEQAKERHDRSYRSACDASIPLHFMADVPSERETA